MKLVFILGDAAVGKMTVGQELMKITDLRLFHNNMTIEPVIEIFGRFDGKTVHELREVVFRNFAASDNYGMIFTLMLDFDQAQEWEYLEHVKEIFAPYGTEFYYVELIAPQNVRLARNATENRLRNKPSKRDLGLSDRRLIEDDRKHRCVSFEGEIPFDNYLRIENTDMAPEAAARLIQETFGLQKRTEGAAAAAEEQGMLGVYEPKYEDLWFRQTMLADEETMSYNRRWGGTVPFPEERWRDWYDAWLGDPGERRFYRYLRDGSGAFVGEIAYRFDEELDNYDANVIIYSKYRGRGYGSRGLELLCSIAKERGVSVLYDDIAADNPAIGMFLRHGFTEAYRTEEKIVLRRTL